MAAMAQLTNYLSTPKQHRTRGRKVALGLGILAVILSGIAGYRAAIDWASLPTSAAGLGAGQLWNDGGIPAIVK